MNAFREKICQAVEEHTQDLVSAVQDLVRYPTTMGQEKEAQEYYGRCLAEAGAKVDLWEPDMEVLKKHPAFVSDRKDFHGSPNVAGYFPGQGGGRSLILSGHMDVVEPGNGKWTYPPFSATLADGKIYGRGAADMKAGLAANLMAMKALKEAGVNLKGDVTILSVIDEEWGSAGILSAVLKGYKADAAIVTEPTGMELFMASNAGIFFKVHVYGKAAHGGVSYQGVNSIYKAMKIINQIRELEESRRLRVTHPLYKDAPIAFCAGVNAIHAGGWPGIVAEETVLEGRICAAPHETVEEVKAELEAWVARAAQSDEWMKDHPPLVEYYPCRWNSSNVELDHPLGLILQENTQVITGTKAPMTGMPASSDSGTLQRYANTPAINFGCPPLSLAHQTDEYVEVAALKEFTKVLALSILDWCGEA